MYKLRVIDKAVAALVTCLMFASPSQAQWTDTGKVEAVSVSPSSPFVTVKLYSASTPQVFLAPTASVTFDGVQIRVPDLYEKVRTSKGVVSYSGSPDVNTYGVTTAAKFETNRPTTLAETGSQVLTTKPMTVTLKEPGEITSDNGTVLVPNGNGTYREKGTAVPTAAPLSFSQGTGTVCDENGCRPATAFGSGFQYSPQGSQPVLRQAFPVQQRGFQGLPQLMQFRGRACDNGQCGR